MNGLSRRLAAVIAALAVFVSLFAFNGSAQAAEKTVNIRQKQQYNCVHGVGYNFNENYFVYSDGGGIYVSAKAGKKGKRILDDVPPLVHCMQIYKNRIYYMDGEQSVLFKCGLSGENREAIINFETKYPMQESDGSDSVRFYIRGDRIYYTVLGDLYSSDMNGKNRKKIDSGVGTFCFFVKNNLYYSKESAKLRRYNIKTKKKKTVKTFNKPVQLMVAEGYRLYLIGMNGPDNERIEWSDTLYCCNVKSGRVKALCEVRIKGNIDKYYCVQGMIVKNKGLLMTTDVNNNDRAAQVMIKENRLNYAKLSGKYNYLGGHENGLKKCSVGYYKNRIIATEYGKKSNAQKNRVVKHVTLVK